jgi:hypothetical protein
MNIKNEFEYNIITNKKDKKALSRVRRGKHTVVDREG